MIDIQAFFDVVNIYLSDGYLLTIDHLNSSSFYTVKYFDMLRVDDIGFMNPHK